MLRRCQFYFQSSPRVSMLSRRPSIAADVNLFHTSSRIYNTPSGPAFNHSSRLLVPSLGQNSTLVLRSQLKSLSQVQIKPQWRDDTLLELVQDIDDDVCRIEPVTLVPSETSGSTIQRHTFGGMQLTFHSNGIKTSLGRIGSFVEVDLPDHDTSRSCKSSWKLIATVPEKCNITCQIHVGDINVEGKLEGDAHLSTSCDANITVGKLRGHNVALENASPANEQQPSDGNKKGIIYIKKAIEARTVQINASHRVRARMINGSDIKIEARPFKEIASRKLDEDDEGAIIDIGSLYISHGGGDSEAQLYVDATNVKGNTPVGIVRVKSNHGHVAVNAKVNNNISSEDTPLIDLGGVNGSCDVLLEADTSPSTADESRQRQHGVATRIHFDAFTPESISTVTARGKVGDNSITIDRKLDAELRLLSVAKSSALLPDAVDAHSFTSDDEGDINTALKQLDELSGGNTEQQKLDGILIETDAFESSGILCLPVGVEYMQGTVKNRSGEPDSRFDAQSRGKINKDGAALQALHGFRSKAKEGTVVDSKSQGIDAIQPLLSVATDGMIKLETLSWLGSIARRYGLEENQKITLGRQASRKPLGWRREWDRTNKED
ncbi:hypothetical protein ACHAXN_004640 [Cyclotella atomus]